MMWKNKYTMNKKTINLTIILVMFILLCCAFIVAIQTRKSFVNDIILDNRLEDKDIEFGIIEYFPDVSDAFIMKNDIKDISDLSDSASVIVKVSVNKTIDRKIYEQSILSALDVKEVYKGDIDTDTIYIFEPFYYRIDNKNILLTDGYNLMNNKDEYILFLKKIKNTRGFGDGKYVYLPTTTIYSKYDVNDNKIVYDDKLSPESNGRHMYQQYSNQEAILDNKEDVSKFNQLKKDVLEKYN